MGRNLVAFRVGLPGDTVEIRHKKKVYASAVDDDGYAFFLLPARRGKGAHLVAVEVKTPKGRGSRNKHVELKLADKVYGGMTDTKGFALFMVPERKITRVSVQGLPGPLSHNFAKEPHLTVQL